MKSVLICLSLCFFAFGCGNAARPTGQSNNTAVVTGTPEKAQTAIAHSSENQTPNNATPSADKAKWTASGDPIDTKELDTAIMAAEKKMSGKTGEPATKKALGDAFYKRAVALTEARQYASALGDYRRTLKYDPGNADAKEWIDKINMIYDGLRKQGPKEGEEPPPLPFSKTK